MLLPLIKYSLNFKLKNFYKCIFWLQFKIKILYDFYRLADYLIATTMHALAKNSTIKVLENISSLVQITPTDEEIKVWRQVRLF